MVKLLLSQKAPEANVVFLNELLFHTVEIIKLILNSQKCSVMVANEITDLFLNCYKDIERFF
jgi:hypothetical protein